MATGFRRCPPMFVLIGALLVGAAPAPLAGQPCYLGGHAGLASPTSSLPLGNFREDPSRGLGVGVELGCRMGLLDIGVAPEVAALESIMAWGFLATVGRPIPFASSAGRGPWLRLGASGGMLLADDGEEGVNVVFPGPHVRVPQVGPLLGASLRLAFPSGSGGPSSFYLEGAVRVGWLDAVIEPQGAPAGDRALVYLPFSVGYTLGL